MAVKADDTFTEALETDLENHTPSPTGTAWQVTVAGGFVVSAGGFANEVTNGSAANEVAKETTDITSANMKVSADCKTTDFKSVTGLGPMSRLPSGDVSTAANRDGFAATLEGAADKSGADAVLYRLDDGTPTELGRFNGNFGNDVVVAIRLESEGNDHTVFVDGVSRIGPITDTAHNTNQFAGIFARLGADIVSVDNYKSEDFVVPAGPPVGTLMMMGAGR